MAEKPPALDHFEQGRAAAEVGRDQQQKQFQPYQAEGEEATPENLMKGNISGPTTAGQPTVSPEAETGEQKPEQLKGDEDQRRAAENMENRRQRSNARRDEINQTGPLRTAGNIKGLMNRKKIKELNNEIKEKGKELDKQNKKLKKTKIKWWRWPLIILSLLFWLIGIGEVWTAKQLSGVAEKYAQAKIIKKEINKLKNDIKNIELEIYNRQNIIKLNSQKEWQARQTATAATNQPA